MSRFPRLAVGTIQPGVDATAIIWALMDSLETMGLRVQSFLSRACFVSKDGATAITGLSPRHLDSWLMSEDLCRELFLRGTAASDFALVEGRFAAAVELADAQGGDLETLCRWLNLPRLAIVDASLVSDCHVPPRPDQVDGLLLDRVADSTQLIRLQTMFESLWGVPVLGSLGMIGDLRREIKNLAPGAKPARELCAQVRDQFAQRAQLDRIHRLACSRDLLDSRPAECVRPEGPALQVAVAYDEVFHCYFPDMLDLLELKGATVRDFSPLRDERLPPNTDIVYFGCGHPERYARELVENHCMMLALKDHLCNGLRLYAECGGLAYLCQRLEMPDGESLPMSGVLPAVARRNPYPEPPRAREITLSADTWLGPAGSRLRGYLTSHWSLEAAGPLTCFAKEPPDEPALVGRHQAIGSRLYLNFAAQPSILSSFFRPHAPAIDPTAPVARSTDG